MDVSFPLRSELTMVATSPWAPSREEKFFCTT
jgi:hypothetical protein